MGRNLGRRCDAPVELLGHVALHPRSSRPVMEAVRSATGLAEDAVAVVARLLVALPARRRGVGRALLDRATAEADGIGRRAMLDVVDDHRAAIALYEACGWTRITGVTWSVPGGGPLRESVYLAPPAPR